MRFHVVHGTGARGADWTKPDRSSLCQYLEKALGRDHVSFSSPEWTGHNTYQARVDGARLLREEVQQVTGDGRVTILVGHSHGGSVIAHALAADEALRKRVDGVIHARALDKCEQPVVSAAVPLEPTGSIGCCCPSWGLSADRRPADGRRARAGRSRRRRAAVADGPARAGAAGLDSRPSAGFLRLVASRA
jgi:pimeloyl-ACP methyl ester carboxylesterase